MKNTRIISPGRILDYQELLDIVYQELLDIVLSNKAYEIGYNDAKNGVVTKEDWLKDYKEKYINGFLAGIGERS